MKDNWIKLKKVSEKGWHINKESRCTGSVKGNLIYISFLEGIIAQHKIRSILDLGCGDLILMKEVRMDDVKYIGVDWVIKEDARENLKLLKTNIYGQLYEGNIAEVELPVADLIVCRNVLIHMTNGMVIETLENIFKRVPKYFLATTHDIRDNKKRHEKIKHPSFSPINMMEAPFSFGSPIETYTRIVSGTTVHTCLWNNKGVESFIKNHTV